MALPCFSCGQPAENPVEITFAGHHLGDGFVCDACVPERALENLRAEHTALIQGGMRADAVIELMRQRVEGRRAEA